MIQPADLLRAVQMPQRGVIEARKHIRAHRAEAADVDIPFAFTRQRAQRREMAHRDQRATRCTLLAGRELPRVMRADAFTQPILRLGGRFTRDGLPQVTLPQKRHRRDHCVRRFDEVFARCAEDMHLKAPQQFARRVQMLRGVMIATREDGAHRFEVRQPLQKIKIQRHGLLRRIRRVKHIAADHQRIDFLRA